MPTYPVTVVTRTGKGSPINAAEFDQNLTTLKDGVNDLNTRVAAVTGGTTPAGNADRVDGFHASQTPGPNLAVVADANGKVDGWVTDATTSAKGKVQLATTTETLAGTDATKAVTPAGLAASAEQNGWGEDFDNFFETNTYGDITFSLSPTHSKNFTLNSFGDITFKE